jgi:hypothetical protein
VTAPPALPAPGRGQVAARITALSAASAAAMPAEAVVQHTVIAVRDGQPGSIPVTGGGVSGPVAGMAE